MSYVDIIVVHILLCSLRLIFVVGGTMVLFIHYNASQLVE